MSKVLLALALFVAISSAIEPGPPGNLIVFGDSLSDTGNFVSSFVQANNWADYFYQPRFGGRYSNGFVWSEYVQRTLTRNYKQPVNLVTYACAGASTDNRNAPSVDGYSRTQTVPSVREQVDAYLNSQPPLGSPYATVPVPNPRDLYVLWAGSNDASSTLRVSGGNFTAVQIAMTGAVTSLGQSIGRLYAAGARRFLLFNNVDPRAVPDQRGQPAMVLGGMVMLANAYDAGLRSMAAQLKSSIAPQLNLTVVNTLSLFANLATNYQQYNFTTLDSCIQSPGRGYATLNFTVCLDHQNYAFWDGIHPSTRMHSIIADTTVSAIPNFPPADSLPCPSTAAVPSVGGAAVVNINFAQILG